MNRDGDVCRLTEVDGVGHVEAKVEGAHDHDRDVRISGDQR
jgi:hypothetical protein